MVYGGALLEIGVQWWTVGGWLDGEVFQNCKGHQDDKKVLVHIIGQTLFARPTSSYSAMSSNTVEVQVCRDS